jgi:hypothetical protein
VSDPGIREVSVHPDCEGGSHWIVESGEAHGGSYVRWRSRGHAAISAPSKSDN